MVCLIVCMSCNIVCNWDYVVMLSALLLIVGGIVLLYLCCLFE